MVKIKFIHTADIHLGLANHGKIDKETGLNSRVLDVLRAIDNLISHVRTNNIPFVFIAGDVFHSKLPEVKVQLQLAEKLKQLSLYADVYVLLGNHDVSALSEKSAVLEIVTTLQVPRIHVIRDFGEVFTENFNALFCGPYMDQDIFYAKADEFLNKVDERLPVLFFCHPMIQGTMLSSGVEADTVKDTWTKDVFERYKDKVDYIGLGHIHKFQQVCSNPLAYYSGSLTSCDFTESEAKGFIEVEAQRTKTKITFVEGPTRRFYTYRGTQEKLLELDDSHLVPGSLIADSILRLNLVMEEKEVLLEKELLEKFKIAFKVVFKIERKDTQAKKSSASFDKEKTVYENLEEYFSANERKQQLIAVAKEILEC